jgi:hypothetical protein
MMLIRRLVLLTILALLLLASHVSVTTSSFLDSEVTNSDTFGAGAWIQTVWTQTTEGDFESCVLTNVDSTSSPGDVKLALEELQYYSSGSIASQVLDTEIEGSRWGEFSWDETLPTGTNITFEVRASDTAFAKDEVAPSWTSVGDTTPVTSGLPPGRYKQWLANLTTSDTSVSPVLNEGRICYY